MYKRITLLAALLMLCLSASAGRKAISNPWTHPVPTASMLAEGGKYYLYNVAAQGFYTGANDWETRASFNPKHGYCANIVKVMDGDTWDGKSYSITYTIETGGDAGKEGCLKILGYDNVWVDELLDGTDDKFVTFEPLSGGTYHIGLSPLNATYKDEGVYLGVRKNQHNDTRLYFLDTMVEDFTGYEANYEWRLVSEDDFNAYLEKLLAYNIAMKLHEALEYAENVFPSINITAEKATFNTLSSDAGDLLTALMNVTDYMVANADADHPVDLTPLMLADGTLNLDYANDNNEQWQGDAPAFQSCQGAEFYSKNYNAYRTLPECDRDGFYQISVDAFYRSGWPDNDAAEWEKLQNSEEAAQNALLYATSATGTSTAPLPLAHDGVTDTAIGDDVVTTAYGRIPNNMWTAAQYFDAGLYKNPAKVLIYAENGEAFTIGVKKEILRDGDWTFLYGWHIAYLGNGDDAANLLRIQHMTAYPDYFEMIGNGELEYYGRDAYDSYLPAYNNLKNATSKEDIMAAIPAFDEQAALMKANVDAYEALYQKNNEAESFLIDHQDDLMGEGYDNLGDYVWSEEGPSPDYPHPNGSGPYILYNGTLSTEAVLAEVTYVQQLMDNALATGMQDGMDVTGLIKNPHFAEEGIWTKQGLPEWPLGGGDYKLAQAFSIVFGVSQEITGLQNGLYELTLNDLYRPANYGSADYGNEPRAYVYMNGFEKKLNSIESGATEGTENGHTTYIDGFGYVPNTVDEAAASFQAGNYKQSLYGLVTDGTMTLGLRNDLRYEGCWAAWSDLHLTFRAKNPEVLADLISTTIPTANDMLGNKCGVPELDALSSAITVAQDAEGEARYDAMVTLKKAMDAVTACTETYVQLNTAISNLQQAIADIPTSSKIDEANALLAEVQNGYNNGTYSDSEAQEKIAEVAEMVAAVRFGDSGEEEVDMSDLIVNRNFDPNRGSKTTGYIEGWTTTAMNGYKEYTVSYNKTGFELNQTITVPKKGKYRLSVHTYYRAGYYNEEVDYIAQGRETHLTTLYAQTPDKRFETPVMNLVEDAQTEDYGVKCYTYADGRHAPDGTTPTAAWFAKGRYLNELIFVVNDDNTAVTFGLSKTETIQNDYEVVGEWSLVYIDNDEDVREDYSELIINNKLDPNRGSKTTGYIEGWTTTAMNGYKEWTASYNKTGFHLYQDITVPKKGNYELTVHTYYRAGYWYEEEDRVKNGEETHLTTLYADVKGGDTFDMKVMNLYEDASTDNYGVNCYTLGSGLYAPDGTTPTAKFFAEGRYLNKLYFYAPDDNSKVRIGLKKDETLLNDYEVVGEWNLYYLGNSTGIEDHTAAGDGNAVAAEFYTLSGIRIDRPQRGINIVKMSDGSVRKVMLK